MADSVRELQVKTLEGGVITVQVKPTTTIGELKAMLVREKKHEDPNERKILKAEIVVEGALVRHCDSHTLKAAGLLDAEFEVVYSINEVEAATKTAIYAKGFVQVNIPASLVEISASAFQDCTQVVRAVIPDSVTAIGPGAFLGCSSLGSINIPESVTAIGPGAFLGCSSLGSINIPESVTAIGHRAFTGCSSLGSITIPVSVTAIEDFAFAHCCSLRSITIPDSVTAIGKCAFQECSSLGSITIPASVMAIEDLAFAWCCSLRSHHYPWFCDGYWEACLRGVQFFGKHHYPWVRDHWRFYLWRVQVWVASRKTLCVMPRDWHSSQRNASDKQCETWRNATCSVMWFNDCGPPEQSLSSVGKFHHTVPEKVISRICLFSVYRRWNDEILRLVIGYFLFFS